MSDRSSPDDIFEDALQLPFLLSIENEKDDFDLNGSVSDDTGSSYYTAVCSASEFDELLKDGVCSLRPALSDLPENNTAQTREVTSVVVPPPTPLQKFSNITHDTSLTSDEDPTILDRVGEEFTRKAAVPLKTSHQGDKQAEILSELTQEVDNCITLLPAAVENFDRKTDTDPGPIPEEKNSVGVHSLAQSIDLNASVPLTLVSRFDSSAGVSVTPLEEFSGKTEASHLPKQELVTGAEATFTAVKDSHDKATVSLTNVHEVYRRADTDLNRALPALSSEVNKVTDMFKCSTTALLKEPSLKSQSVLASPATLPVIFGSPVPATPNTAFQQRPKHSDTSFHTGNAFLSKPCRSPRVHHLTRDIIKVRMAPHTDTHTTKECRSSPRQLNFDTILITPEGNQYSQKICGTLPDKVPPKQGPCAAEVADCMQPSQAGKETRGTHKVGEGCGLLANCRMEQAELSVRDKYRNASASCISTLAGSSGKTRIPPHCYSECILATSQQHQPQSPPKVRRWQKQSGQVAWRSAALTQKPSCRSRKDFSTTQLRVGNNNMGTQLSEAEGEVKALRNLPEKTCSETNYLDIYNLPLQQDSPQPVSDCGFNGWVGDGLPFKLPLTLSPGNHNTSACSETSSVECIDVALETHEEVQRGCMKTVPKRQIQLKRKDPAESNTNGEKSNNKPQGVSRPRDLFMRQHSTPASLHQEPQESEQKLTQADRKQRLQKSLSLDETSSRTKMASCLIANVLSKKMQHEQEFRNAEGPENAYATLRTQVSDQDYCQILSAKENTNSIMKIKSSSVVASNTKVPSHSPPAKAPVGSVKEHVSVNSKTQQKLFTKHSFNPLHCGPGRAEFQDDSPEITYNVENRKAEKPTPLEEAVRLARWSPGEKLSCDSAKGKACWNSSAVISRDVKEVQACLKATPEECSMGKGNHKQQPVKNNQPAAKAWEKDTRKHQVHGGTGNSTEMPASSQGASNLSAEQELTAEETNQPLTPECAPGAWKEQQGDKADLKVPGLFLNTHDKLKGIAPVHVVRDMRSLVKNTYNLSFRGPGDPFQHPEDSCVSPKAARASRKPTGKIDNLFGFGDRQLGKKHHATPSMPSEKARDPNCQRSSPHGGTGKFDKGFSKVSPSSLSATGSCSEISALEGMNSSGSLCKPDAKNDNLKCKQVDHVEKHQQAQPEHTKLVSDGEMMDSLQKLMVVDKGHQTMDEHAQQQTVPLHSFIPSTASATQSQSYPSATLLQTASLAVPPCTQATATCMLARTMTPAHVLPAYYYKANTMAYQTISPHVGALGFMQAPMILQASAQPSVTVAAAARPSILVRQNSEDGQRTAGSIYGESSPGQKGSPKKTTHGEILCGASELKRPSSEALTYLGGMQTILPGSVPTPETHMAIYSDISGCLVQGNTSQPVAQATPRQLLLDPETGRCFYVDMSIQSQPQRKMLFDPETCQYVEVLLPQSSLPSAAIMPTSCTVPLSFPTVYAPYLQSHTQVLSPPGP